MLDILPHDIYSTALLYLICGKVKSSSDQNRSYGTENRDLEVSKDILQNCNISRTYMSDNG